MILSYQPERDYSIYNYSFINKKSIKKIACGHRFTIALDKEGKLYSWGVGNVILLILIDFI